MKTCFILFLLLTLFSFCHGSEKEFVTLARWDFTGGKLVSANGKYTLRLRGNTRIRTLNGKKMLQIGLSSKAEGAQFTDPYKELYVQGPFRYEFTVRMREPDNTRPQLTLFDSKYSYYNPKNHSGLALILTRFKNRPETYRMNVYAGLAGGRSQTFSCPKEIILKEDHTYTLAYEYDGKETFSFFLNGRKVGSSVRKGAGPVAPPERYCGVIGDRYGSAYCHFQGDILSMQISGRKK